MTYFITLSNGSPLPIINEAVKDDTITSISLVGKNYANYGIVLNENFVRILENFSNASAPANPLEGQLWWNSATKSLRAYTGNSWKPFVSTTSATTQPPAPAIGDQWFNTTANQLNIWNGSSWINLGPQSSSLPGVNGAVAEAILDTANPQGTHIVIKHYINNEVVAIDSKDTTFTPAVTITGFATIAPGVNISSTFATPTSNINLASKQYVDTAISSVPTFSLADGTVTPAKLSTGKPTWNTVGNLTVIGTVTTQAGIVFPDGTVQTTASNIGLVTVDNIAPDQLSVGGPYWDTSGNLSVTGTVETSSGFKFPDGTVQTTAAAGVLAGSITPDKLSTGGPYWVATGDVGIGLTNPASKLDVAGDITLGASFTGTGAQRLNFRGANTDSANIRFESSSDASGQSVLILETGDNASEPIVFKQSGQTRMVVGDNIGIGTVDPTQKLTVAGTIESTIGGFKFPDGTVLTTAPQLFPAASLANNGYQRFPSGLILQWCTGGTHDSESDITVTFPIAFPTTCINVMLGTYESSGSRDAMYQLRSFNNTSCVARLNQFNTSGGTAQALVWAVGY